MPTVTLESRGGTSATMQDQKADINQQIQELRTIISLQEQGKKLFMQSAEEKLSQNRGLLPQLRGTVRDDINALGSAEKDQIIIFEACRAQKHLDTVLTRSTAEMAREKLQNDIFDQVNVCNMLLYELKQRDRVLDELQRQLQHLLEAEIGDKQQQAQMQVIRQLENNIEKTLMKVRTGQKVTTLYLAVRDVLRKELAHLPLQLDVLHRMVEVYQGELKGMELMALDAFKATDTAKVDLANLEAQFLMERNLREHSLAAQKERIDKIRLKDASERQRRAQAKGELAVDFPPLTSQETMGAKLEATKSQIEHQAQVTAEVEKVKSAVQCSRLWDIAGRLLAQQKSTVDLQQHIKDCEEKVVVLKDKLKELELKQAELKFHQPQSAIRKLEEDLKINLQQEEARLEQMQAQMLKNQELLLMFENGIDNLFIRLYGITVPDQSLDRQHKQYETSCESAEEGQLVRQDISAEAKDTDEKLQHCEKKLLYLAQLVSSLPAQQSLDEDNETFVKVRNFLEKSTKEEPQNLRISLEDIGMGVQDAFDFAEKEHGHVLTRDEIKKQGLRFIESKMKSGKKKQQSFPKGF